MLQALHVQQRPRVYSPSTGASCSDSGEGFAERMKSEKAARLWAQLAEDHSRD